MARRLRIADIGIRITATTDKLRADLTRASSMIRDWSIVAEGLGGGVTAVFQQIASIGMRAIQIGAIAVAGSFALMTVEGAKFEDAMVRTFTILKKGFEVPQRTMEKLTETARTLGRDTLFSATQAAQGMQILARSGFNAYEVIKTIRPVLNMAIVGNMEMAQAANIAVAALRSFQLSASDAGRVANVLSVLMSRANTDIQMAGEALSYVGAVAHGAGLSLEETAAAIGVMSDAGISSSRAGTTLRRVIAQLQAPSARAQKIFDKLGVTFVDATGDLKPFVTIIGDLTDAGMTAAQAMQTFGLRGGPGMQALLNRGSGALQRLQKELENSTNASERMAQKFRTTVIGRVRDLGASVTNLGLAFVEFFQKPLANVIFGIRNFIKDFETAGRRTGAFRAIVEGLLKVLAPFAEKVRGLADGFIEFIKNLKADDVRKFFDELALKAQEWADTLFTNLEKIRGMFRKAFGDVSFADVVETLLDAMIPIADIFIFVYRTILNIVSVVANLIGRFNELPESTKTHIGWLLKIVAVLGFLATLVTPIITQFIILGIFIAQIKAALAAAGLSLGAIVAAMLPWVAVAGLVAAIIGTITFRKQISELDFMQRGFARIYHWAIAIGKAWAHLMVLRVPTAIKLFKEELAKIPGTLATITMPKPGEPSKTKGIAMFGELTAPGGYTAKTQATLADLQGAQEGAMEKILEWAKAQGVLDNKVITQMNTFIEKAKRNALDIEELEIATTESQKQGIKKQNPGL